MSWDRGYQIMERKVINFYDTGVLTKEKLGLVMEPFSGINIDPGDCKVLRSKDGLSAEEIICKIMEPDEFATFLSVTEEMPNYVQQTADGHFFIPDYESYQYDSWQEAVQNIHDAEVGCLWFEIVRREWGIC